MIDLDTLEKLAKAATPGPWQTRFVWRSLDAARKTQDLLSNTLPTQDWPDAQFISALNPQVVLELIATVREQAGKIVELVQSGIQKDARLERLTNTLLLWRPEEIKK